MVTVQIFLVYFCFNMLYHGTNVGVGMWVATVLNLILFHMLFSYMWPQIVLLEGLAVGGPPVAGLVAQGAQDGVVHPRQHRSGQNAAHGGAEDHDRQAVHQEADVHQTDDRQKAQTGEQVGEEHPAHIPAHQLEEAADAGLAGGVLFHARAGLEIVCRREQTHGM